MFVVASLGVRRMSPAKITASPRCLEMRRAHVFGPGSLVCTQPVVRARCHRRKACRDTPAGHTLLARMVSSSASAPWSLGGMLFRNLGAADPSRERHRRRLARADPTVVSRGGQDRLRPDLNQTDVAICLTRPASFEHMVFFMATVRLRVRALVRGLCGVATGVRRRCRDRPRGRSCLRDRRPGNRARS